MSLKITVEVDGQTEQQIAPAIAQFLAHHPQQADLPSSSPESTQPQTIYHENPAVLKQQIQQLMAHNQQLQAQVSHSQRRLAGTPPPKLLAPQSATPQQEVNASAMPLSQGMAEAPPLPVKYQRSKGEVFLYRLKHSARQLPTRLWQSLIWLTFGQEWLLLCLLLCGGLYGTFTVVPRFIDRLTDRLTDRPNPEFVESADEGPGDVVTPASDDESQAPPETTPAAPATPTSKAGSHPPPPPAFQHP